MCEYLLEQLNVKLNVAAASLSLPPSSLVSPDVSVLDGQGAVANSIVDGDGVRVDTSSMDVVAGACAASKTLVVAPSQGPTTITVQTTPTVSALAVLRRGGNAPSSLASPYLSPLASSGPIASTLTSPSSAIATTSAAHIVLAQLNRLTAEAVELDMFEAVRDRFDRGEFYDCRAPSCMFRLLLIFFRELPLPLIPYERFGEWVTVVLHQMQVHESSATDRRDLGTWGDWAT